MQVLDQIDLADEEERRKKREKNTNKGLKAAPKKQRKNAAVKLPKVESDTEGICSCIAHSFYVMFLWDVLAPFVLWTNVETCPYQEMVLNLWLQSVELNEKNLPKRLEPSMLILQLTT